MSTSADLVIVGGGIVGLATGLALRELVPDRTLTILEKEPEVARHQTGNNSGVIHAGIYYKPGSYKARLCVDGVRQMKRFCEDNAIPYENCGKLIVATSTDEVPRLDVLEQRGIANGVPGLRRLSLEQVREIEPHVRAVAALYSPETAIVDYRRVSLAMAERLQAKGVRLATSTCLTGVQRRAGRLYLQTSNDEIETGQLINCAGLYADTVARLCGAEPGVQIIPFRGEYYTLRPGQTLVRGLIYPVPDPEFPFLGVHFTRRIGGEYEAGPNAVLAFAREGYRLLRIRPAELLQALRYRGFWAMSARYWRTGLAEYHRSLSKQAFTTALQKLVPEIAAEDLQPGGAGVRAQAVAADGSMVDDFRIVESADAVHVLNAPSPAATASLAIGRHIAGIVAGRLAA